MCLKLSCFCLQLKSTGGTTARLIELCTTPGPYVCSCWRFLGFTFGTTQFLDYGCHSWFQTFTVFWMLYSFFWVIPQLLNLMCQHFATHCLFYVRRWCKQKECLSCHVLEIQRNEHSISDTDLTLCNKFAASHK